MPSAACVVEDFEAGSSVVWAQEFDAPSSDKASDVSGDSGCFFFRFALLLNSSSDVALLPSQLPLESNGALLASLSADQRVVVVSGGCCVDPAGKACLVGDLHGEFFASMLGAMVQAQSVRMWTRGGTMQSLMLPRGAVPDVSFLLRKLHCEEPCPSAVLCPPPSPPCLLSPPVLACFWFRAFLGGVPQMRRPPRSRACRTTSCTLARCGAWALPPSR